MNIAIIGDSWAAKNKVAYNNLKKRNFTNVIDFSFGGASNIQTIQSAIDFLKINFKKIDYTIWFHTCFSRDDKFCNDGTWYDLKNPFTPNQIYEKISLQVYKKYLEYKQLSNSKTILIGGLGGVYPNVHDFFYVDFLIENWTNKIFNINLPPLQGHDFNFNLNLIEHKNNLMTTQEQYHYMEIYKILYDNFKNHSAFSNDKNHPNYEIYEPLFDEIKSFIDNNSVL